MRREIAASLRIVACCPVLLAASAFGQSNGEPKLSTPEPSPQARKVYELLCDLEANAISRARPRTILGQHCEPHKESAVGEMWRKTGEVAGRYPGFIELDFGPGVGGATYEVRPVEDAVAFAKERFQKGEAIVGFCFHMSRPLAPKKEWAYCFQQPEHDAAWFAKVVDWEADTPEYKALLSDDLRFAADKLQGLEDAGVPVLFRPYHDMNKATGHQPFWWAARDPEKFKALWNITHNFLVHYRGLNNLIFVWSPYAWDGVHGTDPHAYYPGDATVDVVGVDIYHGEPPYPAKFYDDLRRYRKPRAVAECDKMPVRSGDVRWPYVSELDPRPWAMWTVWGGTLLYDVTGETKPNEWNVSGNHKAIRDTYNYRRGRAWRVLTGGKNATFDWGSLR